MKCGVLYALQRLAGHAPYDDGQRINFDMTAADEGSLGHIFQAHHHARFGAEDPAGVLVGVDDPGGKVWPAPVVHVTDPADLLDPFEAARAWCKKTEKWALLPKMEACFKDYVARYPEPDGRVHGVEWPVTLVLGEHPTRGWGLHLAMGPEVVDGPIPATGWVHSTDGAEIDADVLDMPGHPRHGEPIIVTRRIDAVIERRGRYYIIDHKHLANPSPSAARQEYRIDGGFSLFRMMGMQLWPGRFGDDGNGKNGVAVNLIKKEPTYRVIQEAVPPAPEVMRRLPRRILDEEYRLANLEMDVLDGTRTVDEFPGPVNETVCKGRYGMCHAAREEKSGGIPVCLFGREVCGVR